MGRLRYRGRKADVGEFEYCAGGGELEDSQEKERAKQRELGAKVLTQVGFQDRQKGIVDSSFDKARKSGEKLVGKNAGRRNDAYIQRLEGLIDKHGNDFEKKLWDASIEKLIIQPEDIEESYWKNQEQILRDNGQGRELGEYEKELLAEDIQRQQRESLRDWAEYLGNEEAPYPMWFKVYAWDGMSKMGVFDKEKQEFKKRNEHTVAPYIHLNQAVLGKVYGAIDEFYHRNTEEGSETERDEVLDALVRSGSFNKLYTKFLLEQKVAPKTPERTEDVHGEWIEYLPGQEEELAMAAEGTPWCVASPAVGRNYLETGKYGNDEDWYDEDWYDEDWYDDSENGAKFILFHLKNPETGMLAENACVSIRLGTDGRVAEISGLNEGQALEDALVPIVEEKVRTLDGGEEFLEAFADKKKLIELDQKMQKKEVLTEDEVEFVFEKKRPIKTLDTYNDNDPRIKDLKQYIMLTKPDLVEDSDKKKILHDCVLSAETISGLISLGISPEIIFDSKDGWDSPDELIVFYKNGITNLDTLAKKCSVSDILKNYDEVMDAGIDAAYLINHARGHEYRYLSDITPEMLKNWKNKGIEIDAVIPCMYANVISNHLEELLDAGASPKVVLRRGQHDSDLVLKNVEILLEHGAKPIDLINTFDENDSGRERVFRGLIDRGLYDGGL